MLDPFDPLTHELCFPGSITGQTEVSCPHCKAVLTVLVNDPLGQESCQCSQCGEWLVIDWANDGKTG